LANSPERILVVGVVDMSVITYFAVKVLAGILGEFRPQPTRKKTTYSIPQVTVPACLLAIVGEALDIVKTVASRAKHLALVSL
jgi:hypothetical protein